MSHNRPDSDPSNIQCLLFVTYKGKLPEFHSPETSYPQRDQIKAFALVPRVRFYDYLCRVLVDRGIQVIGDNTDPLLIDALKSERVEVVEILLQKRLTDFSDSLDVDVLKSNLELLRRLLVRYRIRQDYDGRVIPYFHDTSSALEDRNLNILRQLLTFRPDIRHRCEDSGTLLHFAVQNKHEALTRLLLDCGASVNARTLSDLTPLHVAVETFRLPVGILETLIQYGADVNATTESSEYRDATPLHLALHKRRSDLAIILLRNGAHVEANCSLGNVLQLAVVGDPEGVAAVLRHQPDVNSPGNQAALRKALKCCAPERKTVDMLLGYGFNLDPADATDDEILFGAVRIGHVELAEQLITWGANVNSRSSTVKPSLTPLHEAAEGGVEEMMGLLIKHGANIKAKCDAGGTPLRSAATSLNLEAVKALLKHGARFQDDPQLLHAVVDKVNPKVQNYLEPVKFTVENGACVNSLNAENETPLYRAYKYDDDKIMEILLKHGAHMGPDPETLRRVFVDAVECNKSGVVEVLVKHCLDVDPLLEGVLMEAIKQTSPQVVKFFLEAGYPLLELSDDVTVLNEALRTRDRSILVDVLEYGYLNLGIIAKSAIVEVPKSGASNDFSEPFSILKSCEELMSPTSPLPEDSVPGKSAKEKVCRRHLVAIEAAELSINDNASYTELEDLLNGADVFEEDCLTELLALDSNILGDTDVFFSDILDGSLIKIVFYTRNDEIVEVLNDPSNYKAYPIFKDIIYKRFRKAYYRRQLLDQCVSVFDAWYENSPKLPLELQEKILGYLSNQKLQFFSNVGKMLRSRSTAVGDG